MYLNEKTRKRESKNEKVFKRENEKVNENIKTKTKKYLNENEK